jgi:hypothetical protein
MTIKVKHLLIKYLAIFTVIFYTENVVAQVLFNDLENTVNSKPWSNANLVDSTFAFSGKYSAFTDSLHPYGLGIKTPFPDNVKNKNTTVIVEGYTLANIEKPYAIYVVAIEKEGKNIFWKGIPLSNIITIKEQWFHFSDTILIPANITATCKIKTYLWNAGAVNSVFIDDLKVTFLEKINPSFMLDIKENCTLFNDTLTNCDDANTLFSNMFYKIIKTRDNKIYITDTCNNLISGNICYFTNTKENGITCTDISSFKQKIKTEKKGPTKLIFENKNKIQKTTITFNCNLYIPQININIKRRFKKNTEIKRDALLMKYYLPLKEIFRYNRKSVDSVFFNEYWLDKEGFIAGNGNSKFAVYHNTELFSTQIETKNGIVVFNLDYKNDHHYLRFPLIKDTTDVKVDLSESHYKKGDKANVSFNITTGVDVPTLPRFMKNPYGYLATYIWTEHADWTDIRTHRATYFGSEKITKAENATGGFVKYNIPVTKSVFYDNPDSIRNIKGSDTLFTGYELSIKTDTSFQSFLSNISNYGNEICLHTPDHYTTNPVLMNEALQYMRQTFGSQTWIDHGYNNLPENNREDFVCDGIENFASKLWENFGIKYFWTPYQEDYSLYTGWSFDNSIEKVYCGFGDFFPRPDYWTHPTITGNFYHWPTASVLYIKKENLWDYFFSKHRLNDFVDNWSVEINHCYPAWTLPEKGFWKFDNDSSIVAMDGLNLILSRMSEMKNKMLLNVTTIGKFLNYRTSIDSLDYLLLPDGRVKIINKSNNNIKGLSFAIKAKKVLVNGIIPQHKQIGENLIFWFDLNNNDDALIRWIK